ncbi:class F sortase [Microbacterium aoyamense]|uniref:Class F sortase n=1 Tax=Microbacterium aoyamense TaxID=344166 RepID=A0ABN2P9J2_9MICO|nr:class F sortase [Microbacterium aoyamense]
MALCVLLLAGCSAAPDERVAAASSPLPVTAAPAPSPTPSVTPLAEGVPPVRVGIPKIGLDEPLIDLGIADDGAMEVPSDFDAVGWFTPGGRPGGHGPLVIAGHVDSPTGSAVFMRLRELAAGDTVDVSDANGALHTYRVVEVADYSKSDFPTVRVFGAVAADELRLITCGGEFDASVGSYKDNRVVFAVRVQA